MAPIDAVASHPRHVPTLRDRLTSSALVRSARSWVTGAAARALWGAGAGDVLRAAQMGAGGGLRTDSAGGGGGGAGGMGGARTDCGGGGCGPAPPWGDGGGLGLGSLGVALDRSQIDYLCTEQLMRTIVNGILEDALTVRPKLSGETGELSACVEYLESRGFYPAAQQGMVFGRRYGGGATLCFIDDGRPPEEEVDLLAMRGVVGFAALPKWNVVPADAGSSRVRDAWYGPRYGRPEHYVVAPDIAVTGSEFATTSGLGSFTGSGSGGTSMGPGALAGTGAGMDDIRDLAPERRGNMSLRAGQRWHRSRVIPWPYCDELTLRQARRVPGWVGWGPGVVESCARAYLARRSGALRVDGIMRSLIFNTLNMPDVAAAQSTPDGGEPLRNALEWIKACLAFTGDEGLPLVALDLQSRLEAHSHTVSGISDLLGAQRQFLLDSLPEYTEVRLFGASQTGMAGDKLDGQWRAYYGHVDSFLRSWFWTCGSHGGGLKQAVSLAMLCPDGPTRGRYDPTVKATWPGLWKDSEESRARSRKLDAESRAIEKATLGLTSETFLRHDPTVQNTFPSLDVDDEPLPQPDPEPGEQQALDTPAVDEPGQEGVANTPQTALTTLGEQAGDVPTTTTDDAPDAAPPTPATLPKDIHSVAQIAEALGMTRRMVLRTIKSAGIRPFVDPGPGVVGGARFELGKVLDAWRRQAEGRADAMRGG